MHDGDNLLMCASNPQRQMHEFPPALLYVPLEVPINRCKPCSLGYTTCGGPLRSSRVCTGPAPLQGRVQVYVSQLGAQWKSPRLRRKTFKEVVLGCLRGEPTAGYCGFDGPTLASMASNPRAEQVAATPKKKPGPRASVLFCYI